MIRLLKIHKSADMREMMPSNAAQLFASRRQPRLAQRVSEAEGFAQICSIGDFLDYCPHPFTASWPFTPYLKLFDIQELPGTKTIRIIGALSADKKALKDFIKHTPSPALSNHLHFVSEKKLLTPLEEGQWMWLPKGELVRELLVQWWRSQLKKRNFHFISTPSCASTPSLLHRHRECYLKTGYDNLAEIAYLSVPENSNEGNGLFEPQSAFSDRLTCFFLMENFLQSCISSLQFILEIPKILGFEFQIVLGLSTAKGSRQDGAARAQRQSLLRAALEKAGLKYAVEKTSAIRSEMQIELRLLDALGRSWSGPFISIIPTEIKEPALVCSAFGMMERLVGLIVERYSGNLPLWLAPEQVRLIALSNDAEQYAGRVQHRLKNEGIRSEVDSEASTLGHRLYRAISDSIPFTAIVGDREVSAQTLTVRVHGVQEEECMDVDALCERIHKTMNVGVESESQN